MEKEVRGREGREGDQSLSIAKVANSAAGLSKAGNANAVTALGG